MKFIRRNNQEKGNKKTVRILVSIIIFLILFIAFFFIVKPEYNKLVYNKQIEGANLAVLNILNTVNANGYVEIPVDVNKSLVLVPYIPKEQTKAPTQPTE